jgi:hypothetical protein
MRLKESAGAIVIGAMLIGCQGGGGGGTGPKASAPAGATLSSADEQTAAELQRSYRASHPGQQVGYVNAVDPGRRIISVAGIPPEMVRPGAVMSILTSGGGTVEAVAYAHDYGYVQLRYEPLGPGQATPTTGELAVWNPGGQAVIPEAMPPVGTPPAVTPPAGTGVTGTGVTAPGTTGTGITTTTAPTEPPPPPPPVVPSTMPADTGHPSSDLRPPATQPAPTTETPPPPPPVTPTTMPASRPVDFNK